MSDKNGRLFSYASKKVTKWERNTTLPGWWTLFCAAGVVIVIVFVAFSALRGNQSDIPDYGSNAPRLANGSVAPDWSGTDAPSDVQDTPAGTAPASPAGTVPAGTLVTVATASGRHTQVPAAALTLAKLSFQGLYDPAAAAKVPTSSGGVQPAPATATPGTYTHLQLMSPAHGTATAVTLVFEADVDFDGTHGPMTAALTSRTVVLVNGQWRLNG